MGLKKDGRACDNCKGRKRYDFDHMSNQWFGYLGKWRFDDGTFQIAKGYYPENISFIDAHGKKRQLLICQKCADKLGIKTLDQPEVNELFEKLKNELLAVQNKWITDLNIKDAGCSITDDAK